LRGVYCPSDLPDDLQVRAASAALVVPSHVVVGDLSAAWLWGIDLHEPDERFAVPRLELFALRGKQPVGRAEVRRGERDLKPHEIVRLHGVNVTSAPRTAVDIACLDGRLRAMAALDAFMRVCGVTQTDLRCTVARFKGRRGVRQARELIPLASPLPESHPESWVRLMIRDAGLGDPVIQFEVRDGGVVRYRLDLAFPQWRIAIEYDGEEFHGPDQKVRDDRRRAWLRSRGWCVIVVRKEDLSAEASGRWLARLGSVIAERSRPTRRRYARGARA